MLGFERLQTDGTEGINKGTFSVISGTRSGRRVRKTEDWLGPRRGTPGRTVPHGEENP